MMILLYPSEKVWVLNDPRKFPFRQTFKDALTILGRMSSVLPLPKRDMRRAVWIRGEDGWDFMVPPGPRHYTRN
jgi:hypothetical protein